VDLKLMNASILTIRVDQEIVENPLGKTGENFSLDIFNSFAPLQHFGHLQTIALELPYHRLKGVFIHSFATAYALTLQDALQSAVAIDIGAGGTDLCVVENGRIIGNRSFSLGGNAITKRISRELSTSFDEAEAIKIGLSEGKLEKKSHQVIEEAILPDLDLWISSVEFSLKELPMKFLPKKIMITGKGSLLSYYAKTLLEHDWVHHFPLEGELEIKTLDYADLTPSDIVAGTFEKDYLSLVALAVTAEDLLYRGEMMEEILNGVIADKTI
jgi:cell division protein FtsA